MIRWQIIKIFWDEEDDQNVIVSMDVESGNQASQVVLTGDSDTVDELKVELERSSGAFGHLLNLKASTAIDIDAALHALPVEYNVERLEGDELVTTYTTGLNEEFLT